MTRTYVEYDSNNSGGRWWLKDEDWHALERAGWKVAWYTLEPLYNTDGNAVREDDSTPRLVPLGEGGTKRAAFRSFQKDGRWLGALASKAYRPGAKSIREAAEEWETITGQCATDAGCPCCGNPHSFTLYQDGSYVESGPTVQYAASWG
jgi:hypothetical protein